MQINRFAAVVAVFAALAVPAWADDNADANRLFVDAMQAWKQSEQLTGDSLEEAETRLELLQEIETNLNRIVADHPSSNLAVQLLIGPVGPLSLDALPALLEKAEEAFQPFRADEQLKLAERHLLNGDIDNARMALTRAAILNAQQIEGARPRARALGAIAEAQAAAGDVPGARETVALALSTAQQVENAHGRAWALAAIAEAQAAAGDSSGAQETVMLAVQAAQRIEGAGPRAWALRGIAEVQAAAGDSSGALSTAQQIEDAGGRARALAALIESLVDLE